MALKLKVILSLAVISSLVISIQLPVHAANPDDGYPIGEPAPGRTCPSSDVGASTVSSHS